MYIYYDEKTDYLEVIAKKCRNYSKMIDDGIFEIRAEASDKVIGYGLEDASQCIDRVNVFDPYVKLSVYIKMARLKRGLSQSQMAKKMKIGLLPYQRLESGHNNPTLKTLLKLKEVLPEISLEKVAV